MAAPEKPQLFDSPRNVRRLIQAVVGIAVLSLAAELFIERPVEHPWESLFGFYAVFGFLDYVFLVFAARLLRRLVMRRENYYDE